MDRSRHSRVFAAPRRPAPSPRWNVETFPGHDGKPPYFRLTLADSPLHSLVRKPLHVASQERGEPRAVADQHDRAPVGESLAAHPLLALQREGGLPDLKPRPRLVGVDDTWDVFGMSVCVCGEINTRHCPVHGQGKVCECRKNARCLPCMERDGLADGSREYLGSDNAQIDVTYFPSRKRPVLMVRRSRHRLVRFWRIAHARRGAQGRPFLSQSWRDSRKGAK